MKKIFLFLAATTLALSSCSSDDSGSGSNDTVRFTIDGTSKTYKTVMVVDGDGFKTVTATNNNSTSDYVVFEVEDGNIGPENGVLYINYFTGGTSYYAYSGDDFMSNVEINDGSKLKGTFHGNIFLNGGETTKTITNGTFNITY